MEKFIFGVVGTLVAAVIGLLPEIAMYFVYQLIHPTSELARICVLLAFWFGGIGLCVIFACIGIFIFAAVMSALGDMR